MMTLLHAMLIRQIERLDVKRLNMNLLRLIFVSTLTLNITFVISQPDTIRLNCSQQFGAFPTKHNAVCKRSVNRDKIEIQGLPQILEDYKIFNYPMCPRWDSIPDNCNWLTIVSGFVDEFKLVLVDTDDDNDFCDERVLKFPYNRNITRSTAFVNELSATYKVNDDSRMDSILNNELIINYQHAYNDSIYSFSQLVEVAPNFVLYPNPSENPNKLEQEHMHYTSCLRLAEYRRCDLDYDDDDYTLYIQNWGIRNLYSQNALFHLTKNQKPYYPREDSEIYLVDLSNDNSKPDPIYIGIIQEESIAIGNAQYMAYPSPMGKEVLLIKE